MLAVRMVSVGVTGYDSHYMIDENEKYYNAYLKKYEGKITDAKQKQIEKEYKRINSSGNELLASEQKNKAFQVIYDQYTYEREKGSGYILETRGWQSILEHDNLDFSLIICIIILMTALWGNEYETQMDMMLRSCKKGKYQTPFAKVMLGGIISIALSAIFQLIQIIYLAGSVGLSHGNYPIQSLKFFQHFSYHITLSSAVVMVFIIRLIGAVLLAFMTMLINIWIKRKTVSMIISMAGIVLTTIIFRSGSMIYKLPLPLGSLKAAGYLWPPQFDSQYVGSKLVKVCTFKEISHRMFMAVNAMFMTEMMILGVLCVIFFSKWRIKKIHIYKKTIRLMTICFIASTLFATGCSQNTNHSKVEVSISKEDTQEKAVWNGKTIEIDYDNNNIIYTDKSGKKEMLIRDVFPSKLIIQKIFIYQNDCYYLSENDESNGICIRKIDLKNFDNTLIYDSTDENIENYFGIIQRQKTYDEEFNDTEETKWFFVTDGYIYWKKKFYIAQVDIKSGKKKMIAEGVSDDKITYANGILRYVNAEGNTETCKCE
nr:hypothetical protein [uncultured Anaerostipes sp.]